LLNAINGEHVENKKEKSGQEHANIPHAEIAPDGDFSADCQQVENHFSAG
jgi:hypothetical protein